MKLVWKGKYENEKQLLIGNLPENAVKFKEPGTPLMLNLVASIFIIPVFVIMGIAGFIKFHSELNIFSFYQFNILGMLLAVLMVIPHEILHAIVFPKGAEVQIWYYSKGFMAFIFSTCPISKFRFIFLSLLPNIIFGLIPLIVWIFIPLKFDAVSKVVFSFAFFSLLFGIGDYLNVFNATIQMPKNSLTQLYGFNSYWFPK